MKAPKLKASIRHSYSEDFVRILIVFFLLSRVAAAATDPRCDFRQWAPRASSKTSRNWDTVRRAYTHLYRAGFLARSLLQPFVPKIYKEIHDRIGLMDRIKENVAHWKERPIWIHVASNGELEQAIPLMEELKARGYPKVLLTYISPNGKRAVELEIQRRKRWGVELPWDYADYMPFDFPSQMKEFVNIVKPAQFVSVYREIWPSLLTELRSRDIPSHLFVTHFSDNARRWMPFYQPWMELLDSIGTVDEKNRQYLESKFPRKPVHAPGETRIERVLSRRDHQLQAGEPPWAAQFKGKKVLVLGSVWEKDFAALEKSLGRLLQDPEWRIVIAPHFPEAKFVSKLENWFKAQGKSARLWTDWLEKPDKESPIIINNIGQLADLYRVADVVFVGGSFGRRVHSVLEPAAYGKPVITGPDIKNSLEAVEMSLQDRGLSRLHSGDDLVDRLKAITSDPAVYLAYSAQSLKYLLDRTGASRRYVDILLGQSPAVAEKPPAIPLFAPQLGNQKRMGEIVQAILGVLHSGNYILGPEVDALEKSLQQHSGYRHAVGVSNGTDALVLGLRALGLEKGDEVITPAYSFVASSNSIDWAGFRPRFADVDPKTGLISLESIRKQITPRTKAIMAVDLYGRQAPIRELRKLADEYGIKLIVDGAQSMGVPHAGGAHLYTTSFYPTKVLGAIGDAGAVFTDDPVLADRVRKMTRHGGIERDNYELIGTTARIDAIQAAVLNVKLPHLEADNRRRQEIAERYRMGLGSLVARHGISLPAGEGNNVWALFPIQVPAEKRANIVKELANRGIGTGVYYSRILPDQPALKPYRDGNCPGAESLASRTLALPIYPELSDAQVDRVIQAVSDALEQAGK